MWGWKGGGEASFEIVKHKTDNRTVISTASGGTYGRQEQTAFWVGIPEGKTPYGKTQA